MYGYAIRMLLVLLLFSSFMAEIHTMRAKEGEEFTIELASNPTTGYMWKYLEPEGGILSLFLNNHTINVKFFYNSHIIFRSAKKIIRSVPSITSTN